jgi:hypothetical protein
MGEAACADFFINTARTIIAGKICLGKKSIKTYYVFLEKLILCILMSVRLF